MSRICFVITTLQKARAWSNLWRVEGLPSSAWSWSRFWRGFSEKAGKERMNVRHAGFLPGVTVLGVTGVKIEKRSKSGVTIRQEESLRHVAITGYFGGERGIRTLGRLPYTAFPVLHLTTTRTALHVYYSVFYSVSQHFQCCTLRPLGQLSVTPNIIE